MLKFSITIFEINLKLSNDVINKNDVDCRYDDKRKNSSTFSAS